MYVYKYGLMYTVKNKWKAADCQQRAAHYNVYTYPPL